MSDGMVFTIIVFLLLLEKVNTCENIIRSLTIYSLVNLRRNWFYLSPKLLLNPIPVQSNNILSGEKN